MSKLLFCFNLTSIRLV